MPLGKTSLLFASLSRFIAMMDDGQEEPTEATQQFEQYKEKYANMLATSKEVKVDDVFVLSMALAAEQIQSPQMWDTFARIAVQDEWAVDQREYFKSYANLSWAMTKVGYSGQDFWNFIENLFTAELEKSRLPNQPLDLKASIHATICYSLKDCDPSNFSEGFWMTLNNNLRQHLNERKSGQQNSSSSSQ